MHAIVLWGGMCKRLGKTYSVPLRKVDRPILCFVSRAFLHNLVNKADLVHNFCYYVSFLYMFRATMCPSSGGTTVPVRHLVFVTLCGWLSGLQTSSFLYMFRTTMCPSSEEITVSMRHLVFVTLCGWLSGLQTSSFLYMFRATMCPSKGETTVFMRHFVLVTLYGWLSGMQGGMKRTMRT